jgi:hypothetical protein
VVERRSDLYFSPYAGAGVDWPRCSFCGAAPVSVSVRREDAFGSALFCAPCAAKVRGGDPQPIAKVPER